MTILLGFLAVALLAALMAGGFLMILMIWEPGARRP